MHWWHWVVVGAILLVIEMLTGTLYVMWFGLAAILLSVFVALWAMPTGWQILLWAVLSVALSAVWFRHYRRREQMNALSGRASAAIIGEMGLVVKDIEPHKNGRVRFQRPLLGSDEWECMSESACLVGSRVKIISIEGRCFKVAPSGAATV